MVKLFYLLHNILKHYIEKTYLILTTNNLFLNNDKFLERTCALKMVSTWSANFINSKL
jgi:hypothetical protein